MHLFPVGPMAARERLPQRLLLPSSRGREDPIAAPPIVLDEVEPKDEPVLIEIAIIVADISISEGALAEPIPSVEVLFTEASIFAERKNNAIVDAPREKFPIGIDIIADTRISTTIAPLGDVSTH
ncbi:uncharacterized protein LOC142633889 [Castanea sativa]|uniref:uncharacterized protein LOC142633889 n=1 Tax=Castanea sativa TaxID=21020 RepID=UPI003F64E45D